MAKQSDPAYGVRWSGPQFARHSLAHVNRELCRALLATGRVHLSLLPNDPPEFDPQEDPRFRALADRCFAPLPYPALAHVCHSFPPAIPAPHEGRLVLIQPWEYGSIPTDWLQFLNATVHEVWCYSNYVRTVYREAGIAEARLHVVPLGVDASIFNPEAPPFVPTLEPGAERFRALADRHGEELFVFLYVGGTIWRKGIDLALEAYVRAFSAREAVALWIKDTGTRTVYRDGNHRDRILALEADGTRPAVVYLEEELGAHQLAGVFTGADCGLYPYRGEGFCLPALEGMACGIPALASAGGATDDFIDDAVGWRIPAARRDLPGRKVDRWECVGQPWVLEVEVDELADRMRYAFEHRQETAKRGAAAAERVRRSWTWQCSAASALGRLEVLAALGRRRRVLGAPAARRDPDRRRPLVSVVLIVLNESRCLAECLASVAPWADELIVVDTGSTDDTVEIARRFGAKVFHFEWCDDFAAARNESFRHATGEWIFWPDADDVLPWESGEAIRRAAMLAPADAAGYIVPVQFLDGPARTPSTRVDHLKLIRNIPELLWEGRLHEQITPSVAPHGSIGRLDVVVLHANYDTSPEGQARKRERDERILALELAERPNHPFVLFCVGMTDHYNGKHDSAVGWLRRSLECGHPGESQVRKTYALLAMSLEQLGDLDEAMRTVEQGLEVVPGDPELHFHAGRFLVGRGEPARAKEHYLLVLDADIRGHYSSIDMGILGHKTYANLGFVCEALGEVEEAREWWERALADLPQATAARLALAQMLLQQEDLAAARPHLAVLEQEGVAEAAYHLGVMATRSGALQEALRWMERALELNPGHAQTLEQIERLRRALA